MVETIQDIAPEALLSPQDERFTHEPYSGLPLADTRHVLTFTIALPLSLNNMYPTSKSGHRYMTKEGKDFKRHAVAEAAIAMIETGWDAGSGPLGLRLVMWFPNKRRTDLDNRIKAAMDAIAYGLDVDDSRFDQLHVYRAGVSAEPRCECTVWTL